jgi:hypothetical protein
MWAVAASFKFVYFVPPGCTGAVRGHRLWLALQPSTDVLKRLNSMVMQLGRRLSER